MTMNDLKQNFGKLAERGFTLPRLHVCKTWYVSFYARDPASNKMKRKKYQISDKLPVRLKNEKAAFLIGRLTNLLHEGWTPWSELNVNSGIHGYKGILSCLDEYLRMVESKSRKKTFVSYSSRVNILRAFIVDNPIKYVCEFDSRFCSCFLEWLQYKRNACPRTINNYRGWLHGLCVFFINHKLIICNPVEKISVIQEHEKIRKDLSSEMLHKLSVYLQENDLRFYLACLMEYYTMIRPSELVNLTIGDISVSEQSIYVDGRYSKNHKSAIVGLNDSILCVMQALEIFGNPSCYYLFSSNLAPGKEKISPDAFNRRWKKVREKLGWPRCYQFYSLKDSGLRDLANAEGIVTARDQARHSDVAVTNKYLQNHKAPETTKHFKGAL